MAASVPPAVETSAAGDLETRVMAAVLPPDVREAIWATWLHSARWERYYGILASRRVWMERAVRFILIASAMGGVVALVDRLPAETAGVFGAGIGLAVALDVTLRPGRDAIVYALIRDECHRCKIELDKLWRQAQHQRLERTEAERRLDELTNALHNVTVRDVGPVYDKVNRAATAAVFVEAKTGRVS